MLVKTWKPFSKWNKIIDLIIWITGNLNIKDQTFYKHTQIANAINSETACKN